LFAFLSFLLAESGRKEIFKTAFMKDFEQHFASLPDQGKSALKKPFSILFKTLPLSLA